MMMMIMLMMMVRMMIILMIVCDSDDGKYDKDVKHIDKTYSSS